ncbi:hypothetical protein HOI26_00030 [Candidatus Woesearchaeota archaeon]|jgi:hypothetical protein|nr:hypothetical protein [Candidatus Woesearchaeota archaeon]MBT5739462.1 hypothetical protein [Candidatus Woesearchaeota archaeon]
MPNIKEVGARLKNRFQIHPKELKLLLWATLITAFIFSFQDWGVDTFDIVYGLQHLLILIVLVAIIFFFWLTVQKIYGLAKGYNVEFQIWWLGLLVALGLVFMTLGEFALVVVGGVVVSFLPKQRIGEFRYAYSYFEAGMVAFWGLLANMFLAIFFALGLYYSPESYFFSKGLLMTLIMAIVTLIPFDLIKLKFPRFPTPNLPGLQILFASHILYIAAWIMVLLTGALLLTGTRAGLIILVLMYGIAGIVYFSIRSEK